MLFLILLSMLQHACVAQYSVQEFIEAHNAARAQVGVGDIVWDDTVAAFAQDYVDSSLGECNLVHSKGPYGENLAMGSGDFTGLAAMNMWVDESPFYDYDSNTCVEGQQCGHYTQVVWRNSVRLGCAREQCNNGWWFVSCNYDPPGNVVGQKPY